MNSPAWRIPIPTSNSESNNHLKPPSVEITVAPAELFDRISIAKLKCDHAQLHMREHFRVYLRMLEATAMTLNFPESQRQLLAQLDRYNARLWRLEDAIRVLDRKRDFGRRFIAVSRLIHLTNDHRARVKGQINLILSVQDPDLKIYSTTSEPKVASDE